MKKQRSDILPALLFLGPNFAGFVVFMALPVLFSLFMAFSNWDLSLHNRFREEPINWLGLGNFTELLTTADFWKFFGNTFYLMLVIPLGIAGSLFLAVLLSGSLRSKRMTGRWLLGGGSLLSFFLVGLWLWLTGSDAIVFVFCVLAGGILAIGFTTGPIVYRTLFYLPSFTAGVATFLLWKQVYNPVHGPINQNLQPALDRLSAAVNGTPAVLWQASGYAIWAAVVLVLLWLGGILLRNWFRGEFGTGTGLMSLFGLLVGGLTLCGLGLVLIDLPSMATDGLEAPNWLNDVHWAKPAIMIMSLWMMVGSNNMLLYIAGISNIPTELYEVSEIEGASSWQRFWYVTWPQLAPTTVFIVIMSVIGGLQGGFEQARAMTEGGPFGSTTTLSYYVFQEGFEKGRMGYASGITWAMFLMIFSLTLFNYKFGSKYVNE
jgi:multiple sugar transport system permease protein